MEDGGGFRENGGLNKKVAPKFGSFRKSSYLCSVRMSSEGANDLLSKQYSSWTFLTTLRGHSPQGYVLSFSIISEIICLMASLSGEHRGGQVFDPNPGHISVPSMTKVFIRRRT